MKHRFKFVRPKSITKRIIPSIAEPLEQRRLLSGLSVVYSSNSADPSGLMTLSYDGTKLIDDSMTNEQFQVARYYTVSNGVYTSVGGNSFVSSWRPQTDTLTYIYSWGTLTCQYVQVGTNRLNMIFTVNNSASSGVTLGGVVIYPAYIHFPHPIVPTDEQQIAGAVTPATPLWAPEVAYGVDGPAVVPADYSDAPANDGAVMALANDGPATRQMYTSLWSTNYTGSIAGQDYFIFAGTAPKDTMISGQSSNPTTYTPPIFYTNTAPGQSDNFQISLRFGGAGTAPTALATDVEQNYAAAYPDLVNFPDRRPIASIHLASEGQGTATNPNAWTLTGSQTASQINVTTTAGLNNFSAGLLGFAALSITQMTKDHSQGMITWDIEGEQYPQPNPSYIGDPSLATTIAPELAYNYQGNGPLIDQYFSAFSSAGFRVGVTLRPTQVVYSGGAYSQTPNNGVGSVPIAQEITNLETKIAYANSHWGCTLFYIDSTTGFDSAALRTVQLAYPNVLLIPEHNTISTFGTGAPYGELTNDFVGTPANVLPTYPSAFSVIYIADGNMRNYASQLLSSVARGDIMLFRGWYADPNNAVMVNDYKAVIPVPAQPSLTATPGAGVVNLAWTNLGGSAVYNIKRATTLNGTYTPIAYGVFGSSYSDTTVTNYQTYYYIVTGVDGAGNGPDSPAAQATPGGPTVTSPASTTSATVTGVTDNLTVLGTDLGGESSLAYTWTGVSTPANAPAPTFSVNGSNLAKNTTAQFYQAGSYILTATITDPSGFSTSSSVTVSVAQGVQTMYVLPPRVTVAGGSVQQYTVRATDQFSNKIFSLPVVWSVSGGGTISSTGLFTASQSGGNYVVTANSGTATASTTVTVQANAPAVVQPSALMSSTNQLIDIGNGDLLIPGGGAAGLSQVQTELNHGANLGAGYWNGTSGIISTAAANDLTYLTGVGAMLNNNGDVNNPAPIYTSFDGMPTRLNDVLVKYSYYGDANLDGKVDGSDYSRIDNGFLTHATGWSNGDFNYDGIIDGSDYTMIDNAFNQQTTVLSNGATNAASPLAQVFGGMARESSASSQSKAYLFSYTAIAVTTGSADTTLEELHRHRRLSLVLV